MKYKVTVILLVASAIFLAACPSQVTIGKILADPHAYQDKEVVVKANVVTGFGGLGRGVYEGIWVGPGSPIPNVRGIRHIVNWHADPQRSYSPADITTSDAWMRGFGLLAKYGLSFDLQAYPGQFEGLARLIARYPEVQVIVNHTGMAVPCEWETWRAGMRRAAS